MVYHEGLSAISSRTRGAAIGIGRVGIRNGRSAIGGGIYQGRASGVEQTMLSKLAAPPQMRRGLTIFLAISCVFFALPAVGSLGSGQYLVGILDGSIAGILMFSLVAVYERRRRIYDAAMSAYQSTRMCQRCGTFYTGYPSSEVGTALHSDQGNRRAMTLGFFVLLLVGSLAVGLLRQSQSGIEPSGAIQPALSASQGSDEFRWPTEGLPEYIADALSAPDLAPNSPSEGIRELVLGVAGQRQFVPPVKDEDCMGSGGCVWTLVDAATKHNLLADEQGALHKTEKITNGYYDLLVEDKWGLYLYEYRDGQYVIARCYERSNGLGSSARLTPCQGEAESSVKPKASMGYPVSEKTFVDAYVVANSGQDNLSEDQLVQLGHDEYKMGLGIDTQTLLTGGDVLNTRGKRAMDYLDKLDRRENQTQ